MCPLFYHLPLSKILRLKSYILRLISTLYLLLLCTTVAAQCPSPEIAINISITTEEYGGVTAWQLVDENTGQVYDAQNGYNDFETVQHTVCVARRQFLGF